MAYRHFSGVLPSGVEIAFRNLTGAEQGLLTKQKNQNDKTLYFQMLADCITSLGDNTNVNKNDVMRMLTNDRKDALVMLRQFSLKFQETFDFVYTWPLDKTTMQKHKERYSVKFNDEDFERVPYAWVRAEIERLAAEKAQERAEAARAAEDAGIPYEEPKEEPVEPYQSFPVLYTNYNEMLAANTTQRFKMPESGELVEWTLLTGEQEKKFGALSKAEVDSNTMFAMRIPKIVYQIEEGGQKETALTSWQGHRGDILDTEGFRTEIRRVEGTIDTVLSITNEKNGDEQAIDLTATVDFFFPSQAK